MVKEASTSSRFSQLSDQKPSIKIKGPRRKKGNDSNFNLMMSQESTEYQDHISAH